MRIAVVSLSLSVLLVSCKKKSPTALDHSRNDTIHQSSAIVKDSLASSKSRESAFHFVTELCDNEGYFDENKYSREEIEGTYKLWFELSGTLINSPSVFSLTSLNEVRANKIEILAKLDKEFAEKKALLQNLKVANTPYWQNIKKLRYQELLQEYEVERTQIMAYSDPSVLLHHKLSKNCENFSLALNGDKSQMADEWQKLREEMSKRNADPERIMRDFNEHLSSPDWKDYAIVDLITFGWGNCSNSHIPRVSYDEKMQKAFDALFIKIDSNCDEP
ncbi:hypothetical protein [Chryseobacterium sp.]|uniref:hypothetical protein n=1 Tax=Chryseobacterium sp. TaxID=1871047 RepID=UPI0025BA1EB8|nr:hypothetical protein [Chryseobacterium sp.]